MKANKYPLAVGLLLIGLTVGFVVYLHHLERERIVTDHLSHLDRESERLATDIAARIKQLKLMLGAAAIQISQAERGVINDAAIVNLQRYLTGISDDLPSLRIVTVVHATGIVGGDMPDERSGDEISVRDRDYFRIHLNTADAGFYIGEPVVSRIDDKWALPLSVAARDGAGQLLGVVVAFLDLRYFQLLVEQPVAGQGLETMLLHRNGTVLQAPVAYSDRVGQRVDATVLMDLADSESGSILSSLAGDIFGGPAMLGAVEKVRDLPLYVVNRLEQAVIDTQVAHLDRVITMLAVVICVMILALTALQIRYHRQRNASDVTLRENEALLRSVLKNIPLSFTLKDLEGRYLLVNEAFGRSRGHDPADCIGKRHRDFSDDAHAGLSELQDQAVIQTRQPVTREYDFRETQDRNHYLISTKFPVLDDQGAIAGIGTIATDVTALKQVEDLNARLGRIVENATNEIFIFAKDTLRFLQVNRGARKNLGYSMAELLELTPVDIKPDYTEEQFFQLVEPLIEGEVDSLYFETTHLRKDGSTYEVAVNLQFVRTENPPVFIANTEDITDRREVEKKLRQAQKMEAVGQLTGGIAHDFNNLLGVIIGNLDFLSDFLPEDGNKGRSLLEAAHKAALSGATLNRQLLAFSRQQPLSPSVIALNEHVGGMLGMLRRTLGAGVAIESALAGDLWLTDVDPAQVESAILNLAVNARDAMQGEGELRIETANVFLDDDYVAAQSEVRKGEYIVLTVTDSGSGMPPAVLARVFEPFFTTKDIGKGSGLGLSMVFGFAKQSGGHLTIYSEVGHGTTVRLYLPRAQRGASIEAARVEPVQHGFGETILVVEDDPALLTLVVALLHDLGYQVLEAKNGKTAIEILESETTINLLLTDMVLPGGMGGLEVAEAAAGKHPGINILFMSGYPRDAIVQQKRFGAGFMLLEKPFRKVEFARKIREALDGNSQIDQARAVV